MDTFLLQPRIVNAIVCIILLAQWTRSVALQKSSSLCQSKPCQHGGECRDDPSTFLCQCLPPATSLSSMPCSSSSSNALCHPHVCQANATCQPTGARPRELACRCGPGSTGRTCSAVVHLCAQSQCGASARCVTVARGGPRYICLCQPGYAGALCQWRANHCVPNPCRNHAICRNGAGGPQCFCVPGFQGELCEIEVNECISQPCRNRGSCADRIGHYACLCSPGYTGVSCEVQIDECQSQPCRHGGSCHDHVDGFSCICPTGFQGERCEIDIDDCIGHRCQNGGLCIDGINSYSCDCSQIGFSGLHCEVPLSPCWSQPCLNGALCQEEGGNYTCKCWPGFAGHRCEMDVNECVSGPCRNGGVCVKRSWERRYGDESVLLDPYEPSYVCSCPPGLTGALCEEDMEDCSSSPCQNGASCEHNLGGYICICSTESEDGVLYGGQNCTQPLVGCEAHECQNGAVCVPSLISGAHGYSCSCLDGYAGSHCQTPTAFSFGPAGGHVELRSPRLDADAPVNFTLSFRTVLRDSVLVQRAAGGALLTLEMQGGRLRLSWQWEVGAGGGHALTLPQNEADGEWHRVEAVLDAGMLLLRLRGPCREEQCMAAAQVETGLGALQSAFWTTVIGGQVKGGDSGSFIGCVRDVFVDSLLMGPEHWLSTSAVNVMQGCIQHDRCIDDPCANRGECVNLWQGYQCKCRRPYEGQNCADEHIPARFGRDDASSFAVFTVGDEPDAEVVTLSVLLRTRRETGMVLALTRSTRPYLCVWLEEGRVKVQVDGARSVAGQSSVSNGEVHLVTVAVGRGHLVLQQPGLEARVGSVLPVRIQAGDKVYAGGLEDPGAAKAFGGCFKGCMQDLRLNEQKLQFFPLSAPVRSYNADRLVNISEGCVGDDSCASSPCQNGGECVSAWDNFTCSCVPGTSGRHCEEVRWCEISPCPPPTYCRPGRHGYQCISNVTFQNGVTLTFRGNGLISRHLTTISFSILTQQRAAAVLHGDSSSGFVTVSVRDGLLVLELLSPSSSSPSSSSSPLLLRSSRPVADGTWHSVELRMVAPAANASRWALLLPDDREEPVTSDSEAGNLDFLREGVDILLGGLDPEAGRDSVVCLSNVEIGGIVLPYYDNLKLPRPQTEQFSKTSAGSPESGCRDAGACRSGPCLNGGRCEELHGPFRCACLSGWTGSRCEMRTDACTRPRCADGAPCLHDTSVTACLCTPNFTAPNCTDSELPVSICGDKSQNYTCFNGGNCSGADSPCSCLPGFSGHWCEQETGECWSNPCGNDGYCVSLPGGFRCACQHGYAGDTCQIDMTGASLVLEPLWVSLALVLMLMALLAAGVGLALARRRRGTRGTYSPSRQEKEGSRVEMWNIEQPPPTERLI